MLRLRLDDSLKAGLKSILRSKPNLRCEKHPRFNPEQGRGSIRGGCSSCVAVMDAYAAYNALRAAVTVYITATAPYESAKPREKKTTVNAT